MKIKSFRNPSLERFKRSTISKGHLQPPQNDSIKEDQNIRNQEYKCHPLTYKNECLKAESRPLEKTSGKEMSVS